MMPELSLNILDVTQNSVSAGATLIAISIHADTASDHLTVRISDNGCGMTEEQVASVADPFFTSRTTRKVGLGIPFYKMAAELAGGSFEIKSAPGEGTATTALFCMSNVDLMPLGDIADTMVSLIAPNPEVNFVLDMACDDHGFVMDTRQFRQILEGIPLSEPQVLQYIRDFINGNMEECSIRL